MEYAAAQPKRGKYENTRRKPRSRRVKKINWYYDIRIWILPIILLMAAVSSQRNNVVTYVEPAETVPELVEEVAAVETTEPIFVEEDIVVTLARFADSVGAGRSDDVKKAIIWIAINRSEDRSHGYGLSLRDELARPKQWQQYNPNGNYTEDTYKLAKEVYDTWQNGGARMFQDDMLWFVLKGDGSITVRNKFNETKGRAEINIL